MYLLRNSNFNIFCVLHVANSIIIFGLYSWYQATVEINRWTKIIPFRRRNLSEPNLNSLWPLKIFLNSNNEAPAFKENKKFWISIIVLMFLSLTWYQEYRPKNDRITCKTQEKLKN